MTPGHLSPQGGLGVGLLTFVSSPLLAVFHSASCHSVFLPPPLSLFHDSQGGFRVNQSDLHNNALGLHNDARVSCVFLAGP